MQDEEKLIIRSCSLERVLGISSGPFVSSLEEFAFAGRSNVGKSSLINMLLRNKKIARVSSSPGKTRTINYYLVNGSFYLVDLPGYGYAKMSKSQKEEISRLSERYLFNTLTLKKIFLLVDSRHAPSSDDILMRDWIVSSGITPVIIATKADKLKKNERPGSMALIKETLRLSDDERLIFSSSLTGEGREEILSSLT